MKNTIYKCVIFLFIILLNGCVVHEEPDNTFQIRFDLPSADPQTRLSYEKTEIDGREALQTKWKKGDCISLTPLPGHKGYTSVFELVHGEGTTSGVFELVSNFIDAESSHWTAYYPGNRIKNDGDFYAPTYTGQVQTGNGSVEHLEDYHYIRVRCTELGKGVRFSKDLVKIVADNVEESSCMKFRLENLPSIVPVEITLSYITPSQGLTPFFYVYNQSETWTTGWAPDPEKTDHMTLKLEGFEPLTDLTAYMMMSNGPMTVTRGSSFLVEVTAADGTKYQSRKKITRNAVLKGGRLHSITVSDWSGDGLDTDDEEQGELPDEMPEGKSFLLHEAKVDKGADIIIMGDGYNLYDFGGENRYQKTMIQAYEDLFSVEPFSTLKDYFNVYYVNAVSEDRHDAEPYYDAYGNQNGAINGSASTAFKTSFRPGSTGISADYNMVLEFARQAIRHKGGKNGTPCEDENEVSFRASQALSIVMINVDCYAGTCLLAWADKDYGNAYSIAMVPMCADDFTRKWTLIHEAFGHGFGKLADEYSGPYIGGFDTGVWEDLRVTHELGVFRNVNEHWTEEEMKDNWSFTWEETTEDNVYWHPLLRPAYDYRQSEGLGIYRGGKTYINLFCRSSENSIMRHQFDNNGQYFNAISRWAIWYRLMRLTEQTNAATFYETLDDFIDFDSNISVDYSPYVKSAIYDKHFPLAPPVLIHGHWVGSEFVTD